MHNDVCGPINIQARGGYEYFVTFVDDYSRFGYVYLMHRKSDTFDFFREFKTEAKKQTVKALKPFDRIEMVNTTQGSLRTT